MKRLVLGACAVGIALRLSPLNAVFSSVGDKLSTPDSYHFASLTSLSPSALAFASVLCFALTVPAIYLLTRTLFGKTAAAGAVFAFAILPGEYLSRSILGDCDHHALEVLIVAWLGYTIIAKKWWLSPIPLIAAIAAAPKYQTFLGYFSFLASGYATLTTEALSPLESPLALATIVNIIVCTSLLGLSWSRAHTRRWLFTLWTIAAVALALTQRRFGYYLPINLAVLLGYGVSYAAERWHLKWYTVVVVLFIAMMPAAFNEANTVNFRPSDEWMTNLERLGEREKGDVLAWWDYGYWIEYIACKPAVINPGQDLGRIREVAPYFLSSPSTYHTPPHNARYVIVDEVLVEDYVEILEKWANTEVRDFKDTLVYQLYYHPYSNPNFLYLYGDKVKVFEIVEPRISSILSIINKHSIIR